jgi:hypothetical protein
LTYKDRNYDYTAHNQNWNARHTRNRFEDLQSPRPVDLSHVSEAPQKEGDSCNQKEFACKQSKDQCFECHRLYEQVLLEPEDEQEKLRATNPIQFSSRKTI